VKEENSDEKLDEEESKGEGRAGSEDSFVDEDHEEGRKHVERHYACYGQRRARE
jgi:hypothetical protein